MIYYVSLDNPHPSGGVKTQYRHVEILNQAGRPATMLHQERPFTAATWFDSTAPVAYIKEVEAAPGDIVVWPEILRASISGMTGVKQVVFNQNIHYTWRGQQQYMTKYQDHIIGSMVLTEYERDWLLHFVPGHHVGVVRHGIDPGLFGYDGREKKKQIAFMPRKHGDEAQAVFGWLYQTDALKGWKIVEIHEKTERQSAEILKDSQFFFAFGYPEGGTLPPFEAMMAGCTVVGYGGYASDRLLQDAGGWLVPSGDTCKFAGVAQHVLRTPKSSAATLLKDPVTLRERLMNMFPLDGEKEQLLQFMESVS